MLFDPIDRLRGVGPARIAAFHKLGIRRMVDLVMHLPRRYEDRRTLTPIGNLRYGNTAIISGTLENIESRRVRPRLNVHKARIKDSTGSIVVTFFNQDYIIGKAREGGTWTVFGTCERFGPDRVFSMKELDMAAAGRNLGLGTVLPYYPASAATPQKYLRRLIHDFVRGLAAKKNGAPDYEGLPSFEEAARMVHMPVKLDEIEKGRRRLAMDELVTVRLCVERVRRARPSIARPPATARPDLSLPFALTHEQERIAAEIAADLEAPHPMRRLVEGDVGSGKTVLGILAAVRVATRGLKTAFMAPTEILAEQHYRNWAGPLEKAGVRSYLLSGSTPPAEREAVYRAAADEATGVFFGTHALLTETLVFAKLGFVVIDEQQRFGVVQRDEILRKGESAGIQPDMLILTATPIPRTLAMTLYGDLEISTLKKRLPGQSPIATEHLRESERKKMMPHIRTALAKGERVFIIYPLIDESEESSLRDAKGQFEKIRKAFSSARAALLTGETKPKEKESVMRSFRDGEVSILVATSVVEVGIDVPQATLMIIEHAEHFGLAQLHQLRGRVGRGDRPGLCVLTTADEMGEYAERRIAAIVACADGFLIAQQDLELRGPGEWLGERQHGGTELAVARLGTDADLIPKAAAVAASTLDKDPALARHDFLRRAISAVEAAGADAL